MRNYVLFFLWLAIVPLAVAQSDEVLASARQSIKAGDARALSQYFNETIELGFDGQKATYGRTQAEFVIRDFLQKHPATGFEFVHRGASKDGIRYCIGKYTHARGSYRVVMLVKPAGNRYQIDTMDFMEE